MAITSINNGTIQFGVDLTSYGGALVELKFVAGSNYVDDSAPGRQFSLSIYDANGVYTNQSGPWGWNPVESGDQYGHSATVLASSVGATSIYTKCRPLEWYPDDKGGGPGTPVNADCYIEKTVEFVASETKAIKVTYRLTYFGTTNRLSTTWEVPAAYLMANYRKFVRYNGDRPWTNDALTIKTLQQNSLAVIYASEFWCALTDTNSDGVAIYAPGHMPQFVLEGIDTASTNYIRPLLFRGISQNEVQDFTYYIVLGDVVQARDIIKRLNDSIFRRWFFGK